jgi:hypothetical protein
VDDESDWQRQVLIGLLVLVTVGAVVGGIVALVTIKAADLAGIDDTAANTGIHHGPRGDGSGASGSPESSDSSVTSAPTTTDTTDTGGPTGPTGATGTQSAAGGFTLEASPLEVAASERIDLTGSCTSVPSGAVLQVQRKESGAWTDFPVTATCSGGSYSTYILTGHSGPNRLRMLAIGLDETSKSVVVQVS